MQLLADVLLEGIVLAQTLYIAVRRFCGKLALDRCALLKLLLLLAELYLRNASLSGTAGHTSTMRESA